MFSFDHACSEWAPLPKISAWGSCGHFIMQPNIASSLTTVSFVPTISSISCIKPLDELFGGIPFLKAFFFFFCYTGILLPFIKTLTTLKWKFWLTFSFHCLWISYPRGHWLSRSCVWLCVSHILTPKLQPYEEESQHYSESTNFYIKLNKEYNKLNKIKYWVLFQSLVRWVYLIHPLLFANPHILI